jgi:GNAT superfamily N-acetyltransferase
MRHTPLVLRRATEHDHNEIIGLIDAAAEWLRTKNTDQWVQPWPSEEDRSHRIRDDLRSGKTWIASEGDMPIATITASGEDSMAWPRDSRRDRAVYVCRLVVSRANAGQGLGADLLNWAALRARDRNDARWVRVNVWTTNDALHAYYRQQGFGFCGFSEELHDHPSLALFQKPTAGIEPPTPVPFRLIPQAGG